MDFPYGGNALGRRSVYRALVMTAVDAAEIESIRQYVQRQHAYDIERFRRAIEAMLARSAGPWKIGRPRKSGAAA